MDSAPPILTEINHSYLECTIHSSKYHCLLKLRSHCSSTGTEANNDDGKDEDGDGVVPPVMVKVTRTHRHCKPTMAVPDISSLRAIPIHAVNVRECRLSADNGGAVHYLLPKLFNAKHHSTVTIEGNTTNGVDNNIVNNSTIRGGNNHPSHEFIRITHDMEDQLKERLGDASDGAMMTRKTSGGTASIGGQRHNSTPAEIHEEFLLRCEAIMLELTSAVQQQLRREEKLHRQRSEKKRKGITGEQRQPISNLTSITSSSLISPPYEYYSALIRQLRVLSSMSNVTDISLHKQSTTMDNTNNTNGQEGTPADLTSVSITCLDANKRIHTWHAELYPSIVVTVDLPSEFVLDDKHIRLERWWEDGCATTSTASRAGSAAVSGPVLSGVLPRLHKHFEHMLQKYQPLFDELDDLDSHLWILEPSLPARRCCIERRIALWEGGASMVIALDPENARGVPIMVRFLGVTLATMKAAAVVNSRISAVATSASEVVNVERTKEFVDWRTSFSEFVSLGDGRNGKSEEPDCATKYWSEKRSIRENLEVWFGSPLPSPLSPSTDISDFLVECGICYTHRLPTVDSNGNTEDGPLPEAKCSNPSCNRHYHESCLFEWLHSLPTARVSFDRMFGSCMYCCEPVSVKILNGAHNQ